MGENGEETGCRDGERVELNFDRNGVADDGGGEVGRKDEAEHRAEGKRDCFVAKAARNDKMKKRGSEEALRFRIVAAGRRTSLGFFALAVGARNSRRERPADALCEVQGDEEQRSMARAVRPVR